MSIHLINISSYYTIRTYAEGGDFLLKLKNKKIGFILTGSFCTFKKTIEQMENIVKDGGKIIPIMSYHSYELDTKFGKARRFY